LYARGKQAAMKEPEAPKRLKEWRKRNGLTVREAGALIVVDGKPVSGPTWHGWEARGKLPLPAWMLELCRVTGLEPNDFYPRPDAAEADAMEPLAA
jgi:hypothetical protein